MQVNFRLPEIFLGALFAVCLIAMGFVWGSSKTVTSTAQQITAQQSDEKNAHSQEKKTLWIPEDATGFFTLWVALFTGVLAFSTVKLYGSTRLAADAAKKSADAAMGVSLPRFEVTSIRIQKSDGETLAESLMRPIQVTLMNLGQSSAVIVRECFGFVIGPELPALRYPLHTVRDMNFGPPVEPRECHYINGQLAGIANGEVFGADQTDIGRVASRETLLWVYGYIAYRDFLGETHIKGFSAGMQAGADGIGRFVQAGPEAYNYTKRE